VSQWLVGRLREAQRGDFGQLINSTDATMIIDSDPASQSGLKRIYRHTAGWRGSAERPHVPPPKKRRKGSSGRAAQRLPPLREPNASPGAAEMKEPSRGEAASAPNADGKHRPAADDDDPMGDPDNDKEGDERIASGHSGEGSGWEDRRPLATWAKKGVVRVGSAGVGDGMDVEDTGVPASKRTATMKPLETLETSELARVLGSHPCPVLSKLMPPIIVEVGARARTQTAH